jgi:hypothetical protein
VEILEDTREKSFSVYFGMFQEGFEYAIDLRIPAEDLGAYLKFGDVLSVAEMPKHATVPVYCFKAGFLKLKLEIPVSRSGDWNGHFDDSIRLHATDTPKSVITLKFSAKVLRKFLSVNTAQN